MKTLLVHIISAFFLLLFALGEVYKIEVTNTTSVTRFSTIIKNHHQKLNKSSKTKKNDHRDSFNIDDDKVNNHARANNNLIISFITGVVSFSITILLIAFKKDIIRDLFIYYYSNKYLHYQSLRL